VIAAGVNDAGIRRASVAAAQHFHGTICGFVRFAPRGSRSHRMTASPPRELFIQGITRSGKTFRPSDWAERLAGALSCFRPGGVRGGPGSHIGYSPYCVPTVVNGVKCVIVNEALRGVEPMAWDFVMNFARDNELQVAEACSLPEPGASKPAA
jgi:hypothetical protein